MTASQTKIKVLVAECLSYANTWKAKSLTYIFSLNPHGNSTWFILLLSHFTNGEWKHRDVMYAAQGSTPVSGRTRMKAGLWFSSQCSWWVALALFCCCTKSHRQDDLNHQHLFLSLEAEKSKIKVPEDCCLVRSVCCLYRWLPSSYVFAQQTERKGEGEGKKREWVLVSSSSYKGTNLIIRTLLS